LFQLALEQPVGMSVVHEFNPLFELSNFEV
jgi:hypothetical protein